MTPLPTTPSPMAPSGASVRRQTEQEPSSSTKPAHGETRISIRSGLTPALRDDTPSGDSGTIALPVSRDTKSAGWRLPWKASLAALLLGTATVQSARSGLFGCACPPPDTGEPAPATPGYGNTTVLTRAPAHLSGSSYITLDDRSGTNFSQPCVSGGVSPSTAAALASLCTLGAMHTLAPWLSHAKFMPEGPWRSALQRHESLLGENLSVRGLVQMYNYANLAVPGALKPNATQAQQFKWATAAALGFNARMFIETAESAYVWPKRPGSEVFDAIKHKLSSPDEPLRHIFPVSSLVGLPLVAKTMDESQAMGEFNRLIGWGKPALNGMGHVAPPGFNNQDGLLWFQSRFHVTALLSELFNLFGTLVSGKDYDYENGLGAALNVWVGPQVGALGVTITQLIPIIGRINALQHGSAGPQFIKDLSHYQAGRYLIYALATPLLTLPQYDFVMTLMANVPNGKGIRHSGMAECIKQFGRPCVGGPTSIFYETSGHSPLAFVPLAVSAATQLALLLYLKRCATASRIVPDGKSSGMPVSPPDSKGQGTPAETPSRIHVDDEKETFRTPQKKQAKTRGTSSGAFVHLLGSPSSGGKNVEHLTLSPVHRESKEYTGVPALEVETPTPTPNKHPVSPGKRLVTPGKREMTPLPNHTNLDEDS
jgi:hypothetical protein